ncbi:MAG: zinc-ribbon domain-containing protein, partial [Gammaproteobacteria bacterium]|nr:zinc-ribbon domain-containing protein [Gammaproteobacteria bacterium]
MIVTCNNCNTRYNINESALKKAEVSARCAKCKHVFTVRKSIEKVSSGSAAVEKQYVENQPVKNESINIDGINVADSNKNAKIISVCNQKGGVAKTTT